MDAAPQRVHLRIQRVGVCWARGLARRPALRGGPGWPYARTVFSDCRNSWHPAHRNAGAWLTVGVGGCVGGLLDADARERQHVQLACIALNAALSY